MKPKMTEGEAYEMYDDLLDECYPVKIGHMTFDASKLLAEHDPTGYRTGFNDYIDSLSEDYDLSDWLY